MYVCVCVYIYIYIYIYINYSTEISAKFSLYPDHTNLSTTSFITQLTPPHHGSTILDLNPHQTQYHFTLTHKTITKNNYINIQHNLKV
jgi:hypothetical protein